MEAVSFLHYIRHRSLISLEEINASLVFMRANRGDVKVNVLTSNANTVNFPIGLYLYRSSITWKPLVICKLPLNVTWDK